MIAPVLFEGEVYQLEVHPRVTASDLLNQLGRQGRDCGTATTAVSLKGRKARVKPLRPTKFLHSGSPGAAPALEVVLEESVAS